MNWGAACASAGFGAVSGALSVLPVPTGAFVAINTAISGLDNAVNQGLNNGFDNINYGEVAFSAAVGAVSSRKGPVVSKSDMNHIVKQNNVRKNKIDINSNATKYYNSQTSTIKNKVYKKNAVRGLFSIADNSIKSLLSRL